MMRSMNKLALILLSSPTVLGSMVSMVLTINPAHAAEPVDSGTNYCGSQVAPRVGRLTCARFSQTTHSANLGITTEAKIASADSSPSEVPMLEFTEEESEAAQQLFGCDCIVCINAIRQMRGLAPIS